MPTDPFVAPRLEDEPRQEPNLAPGVHYPPAAAWVADRPGDVVGPSERRFDDPGPDAGYALSLIARRTLVLGESEDRHDAEAVVSELAMRRAASFGRAPTITDVDIAIAVLGYDGDADGDFLARRARAVHGAGHDYPRRRALVNSIPADVLRASPGNVGEYVAAARSAVGA